MNKIWKNVATLGLVVCVSVGASAVTYRVLDREGSMSHMAGMGSTASSSVDEYGFSNVAYSPAVRQVGSAPDLVPAAESSVRAVVHIKVEKESQAGGGQMVDPFEFFFGGNDFGSRQAQPVVGYGSGVIISTDGYIMTNNHVIEGSKTISVVLNDKRTFSAKLIGTDPATDIALLKIEGKDLPTIPFGNSDDLHLGEWVLAVGNPFNLTGTVTAGIVSAKSRTTPRTSGDALKVEAFIQTDAAVNAGNSGGALVNASGELVGINTMIYSQTGNYAGYSFAVPINIAAKVVSDIKKYGIVQRALLGIAGTDVNADLVKKEGLKVNAGVYVADFAEISAALAAGVEKGDVIVSVADHKVSDFGQLQEQIGRFRPGDTVKVVVNRKGKELSFDVKLKNETGGSSVVKETASADGGVGKQLGATFKALDAESLRPYGLSYGLKVEQVNAGVLRTAGIKQGFIILSASGLPIRTVADLNKAVKAIQQQSSGRGGYRLLQLRGFYPEAGDVYTYTIDLGSK